MGRDGERRGVLRRLREVAVLGAYRAAVERAERYEAMGQRWRSRRARGERERLRVRLEALGVEIPPDSRLSDRIADFVREPAD